LAAGAIMAKNKKACDACHKRKVSSSSEIVVCTPPLQGPCNIARRLFGFLPTSNRPALRIPGTVSLTSPQGPPPSLAYT
jgi:hypothetical protein